MHDSLSCDVGGVGFFCCREKSDMDQLSSDADARLKFSLVATHAENSEDVIAARPSLVLGVESVVGFPQVCNGIVPTVAVDMVNFPDWPLPVVMQPCKTVRFDTAAADLDNDVALCLNMAGNAPRRDAPTLPPSENTARGVVVEQGAQSLGGEILVSHGSSILAGCA
jgi:hypothetical protein